MQDCCCLCSFPVEFNPTLYQADQKTMYYADFIMFKEHKFWRNIFLSDELAKIEILKDLKTVHEKFIRFLIIIFLQNAFNTYDEYDEYFNNDDLLDFCKNNCADSSGFD